jgi:hypothetical protein
MKRDSSNRRSKLSEFLLIPPAGAIVSLGMVLPEYLLVFVVSAFLATMVLTIVQTFNRGDDRCHAKPPVAPPRVASNLCEIKCSTVSAGTHTSSATGVESLRIQLPMTAG